MNFVVLLYVIWLTVTLFSYQYYLKNVPDLIEAGYEELSPRRIIANHIGEDAELRRFGNKDTERYKKTKYYGIKKFDYDNLSNNQSMDVGAVWKIGSFVDWFFFNHGAIPFDYDVDD